MTLSIPKQRDPIARFGLFALIATVVWVAIASATQPTPTAAQSDIILLATATPALPTPAQDTPALALAVPTATPQTWIDQALGNVGAAADQMAANQAALLVQEQAAAQAEAERLAAEQAARDQYLANVGAQASHSPRGDVSEPPPSQTGPIQYQEEDGTPYIIAPAPAAPEHQPVAPAIAVAVPAISQEQAQVIGARESNGCPDGQMFYPRTGCHAPGSGGPQPGAVGEGK